MNLIINKLLVNSFILFLPGILSILLSLFAIPIHLNIAGIENYGNYIIFHFLLIISTIFNFGIGKSIAVSINNQPKKNREISYQGIKYTFFIILFSILFFIVFFYSNPLSFISKLIKISQINYLLLGIILTILYSSFEGVFQGYQKFKSLSVYNFIFYSLSLSLPSLFLLANKELSIEKLIIFSITIKLIAIILMFASILKKKLILKSKDKTLLNNLKINARWLTLNSTLIHFYDLFDKYLVKIFLGPIAIATYSIPQQLTGKLSIISKGFSAYLLPNLSQKKNNNISFNFVLKIFLRIIPIFIFIIFPLYDFFLSFWLGNEYNQKILVLTKIFSICAIFSCTSHLMITKFEASKTLSRNLKIEFILMPFFISFLYYLSSNKFSLIEISFLILFKEFILLALRLNLLKKIIKNVIYYYLYITFYVCVLLMSISFESLFYISLILLIFVNLTYND